MGAQRIYLAHSCFPVVFVLDDSRMRAANLSMSMKGFYVNNSLFLDCFGLSQ